MVLPELEGIFLQWQKGMKGRFSEGVRSSTRCCVEHCRRSSHHPPLCLAGDPRSVTRAQRRAPDQAGGGFPASFRVSRKVTDPLPSRDFRDLPVAPCFGADNFVTYRSHVSLPLKCVRLHCATG